MAIIECFECKKEVSSEAKACPHCGVVLKNNNKIIANLIVISALLVLGYFVFKYLPLTIEARAKKHVAQSLYDPESAVFSEIFKGKDQYTLCGFVNAKNRLGAFVGETPFFYEEYAGQQVSQFVPEPAKDSDFKIFYTRLKYDSSADGFEEISNKCTKPKQWQEKCGVEIYTNLSKFCESIDKDDFYQQLSAEFD